MMASDEAREKAEALRWLRGRLRTEALLTALHGRADQGVIDLSARTRPKRRPSAAPAREAS